MASSISSESDENNAFKTAWKVMYDKCVRGANEEKLGLLVRLWKSLEKEMSNGWGRKLYHRDYLRDLLKLTLSRSIESDWPLNSSEADMIHSSLEALKSLSSGASEANAIEHVKVSVKNPWNNAKMMCLLSRSSSPQEKEISREDLISYMLRDGLPTCQRRLDILSETGHDRVVFNVADLYVRRAFTVPKFMELLLEKHLSEAVSILLTWLTLSFKLKDSSQLYPTLKSIPFSLVYETLTSLCRRLQEAREEEKEEPSSKTPESTLQVLQETYNDSLICAMDDLFTRKGPKPPEEEPLNYGEKVSALWVDHFQGDIPKIKGEVECYMRDSSNSELMISLGHRLFQVVGESTLDISLSLIMTGIIADLNTSSSSSSVTESSEEHNNSPINARLSKSFILLSGMIPSNLTFRRECILTAFSLSPSKELLEEIKGLAQESGFIPSSLDVVVPPQKSFHESSSNLPREYPCALERFEDLSLEFIDSLGRGEYSKASSGTAFKSIADGKERNLDGLLLIEGELLTRSSNYNPLATPVESLSPKSLGLSPELTSDLISVVNAPRWHALSWVKDWPELEKQALRLLENPSLRESVKDLKYLVIDYTQFDDWSSDEEISPLAGVEPGFENWDGLVTPEPEQIDEKGLSEVNEGEEDEYSSSSLCSKRPKMDSSPSSPPSPQDIQTLIETVPGLKKPEPDLIAPTEPIEMDVRIVQLTRSPGPYLSTSPPLANNANSNSSSSISTSSGSSSSSVDTIANTLISLITTPVISIPSQKPPPPRTTNIIKIITPLNGNAAASAAASAANSEQHKNSSSNSSSSTATNSVDLIRQLNLARSQGLVVLQQWGDKQVLVHKATGRWIMRQGNRLVTVPPQALGINTTNETRANTTPSPHANAKSTTIEVPSSSPENKDDKRGCEEEEEEEEAAEGVNNVDKGKNSTLKQLAEFDSILESKFNGVPAQKSSPPPPPPPPPTYVILRSSLGQSHASSTVLSKNTLLRESSPKPNNVIITSSNKSNPGAGGGSSSKPQEDPVTLKRIQQILDDYNEQIRKSPDLQNRPAPRRRTLSSSTSSATSEGGGGNISSPPATPPDQGGQSPPTKQRKLASSPPTTLLRQVVLPPSKKQLVFLSSGGPHGGGAKQKILALKPLIIQQQQLQQHGGSKSPIFLQQISKSSSPCLEEEEDEESCPPLSEDEQQHYSEIHHHHHQGHHHYQILREGIHEMLTPPPSTSSLSPTLLSPPESILDRPSSPPGFGGIPMEMTPGQIMEAEISADDNNPYSPLSQCSSSSSSNRSESF